MEQYLVLVTDFSNGAKHFEEYATLAAAEQVATDYARQHYGVEVVRFNRVDCYILY